MLIIYIDVTMLTTCTGVGKYKTIQKKGLGIYAKSLGIDLNNLK